jgi:hypothetical protein
MEGKVGVGPNKRRKFHGKKAMVITEETIWNVIPVGEQQIVF